MWSLLDNQGKRHNHLTEQEVVEKIRAQAIDETTLLWRRGFVEWKQLGQTELAAYLPATKQETERYTSGKQFSLVNAPSLQERSVVPSCAKLKDILGAVKTLPPLAMLLCSLQLIVALISLSIDAQVRANSPTLEQWKVGQQESLNRIEAGEPNSQELFLQILLFFQLLASVLFAIHWLRWQYRAGTNAKILQLRFTPHPLWSLIWWFLPLVQLFMPWSVLKSLVESCGGQEKGRKLLFWAGISWVGSHLLLSVAIIFNHVLIGHSPFLVNKQTFMEQFSGLSSWMNEIGFQSVYLFQGFNLFATVLSIISLLLGAKLASYISAEQFKLATNRVLEEQNQKKS